MSTTRLRCYWPWLLSPASSRTSLRRFCVSGVSFVQAAQSLRFLCPFCHDFLAFRPGTSFGMAASVCVSYLPLLISVKLAKQIPLPSQGIALCGTQPCVACVLATRAGWSRSGAESRCPAECGPGRRGWISRAAVVTVISTWRLFTLPLWRATPTVEGRAASRSRTDATCSRTFASVRTRVPGLRFSANVHHPRLSGRRVLLYFHCGLDTCFIGLGYYFYFCSECPYIKLLISKRTGHWLSVHSLGCPAVTSTSVPNVLSEETPHRSGSRPSTRLTASDYQRRAVFRDLPIQDILN